MYYDAIVNILNLFPSDPKMAKSKNHILLQHGKLYIPLLKGQEMFF